MRLQLLAATLTALPFQSGNKRFAKRSAPGDEAPIKEISCKAGKWTVSESSSEYKSSRFVGVFLSMPAGETATEAVIQDAALVQ
jgi:hypothetical protein